MKYDIPINKGPNYEYRITNFFQNQGYLTRRAIPLQYGSGKQNATDIDVLGIVFSIPFKYNRILCDVKNKARSNPHERVFWAKGLGEFIRANEVYVALPTSSWEFIKFAKRGKVRVITSDIVDQSLKNAFKFGLADEMYYSEYFKVIEKVMKTDKKADEIISIIRKLYLKENPYVNLNIVLSILTNEVPKHLKYADSYTKDVFEFWKYVCCELTVILSIQLLLICSDVLGLPKHTREKQIMEKLSYGDMDPAKVREILNSAEDYANEIVKAKIPQSLIPQGKVIEFEEITPPAYASDIVGLIDRVFQNPDFYISLPQLLDFILFEQGLKGKELTDLPYRDAFKYSFPDEKFKSAKNILSFLRDRIGVNWDIIWSKNKQNYAVVEKKKDLYAKDDGDKSQQKLFKTEN